MKKSARNSRRLNCGSSKSTSMRNNIQPARRGGGTVKTGCACDGTVERCGGNLLPAELVVGAAGDCGRECVDDQCVLNRVKAVLAHCARSAAGTHVRKVTLRSTQLFQPKSFLKYRGGSALRSEVRRASDDGDRWSGQTMVAKRSGR